MLECSPKQKIIIIEGMDNCGKDTLIQHIQSMFNGSIMIHSSSPASKDNTYAALEVKATQQNIFEKIEFIIKSDANKVVMGNEMYDCWPIILNRSMYGELIYGPKYRHAGYDFVLDYVRDIELKLESLRLNDNDVYYIQLVTDSVDFIQKNDDGKSLSKNDTEALQDEIDMYNMLYKTVGLSNKLLVTVNIKDRFKAKEVIFNEVDNFIGLNK